MICSLCPRNCRVSRDAPEHLGFCDAGLTPRVFRYGPHFGEEPPVTGEHGSGTVFCSHCTLRCLYCQNHPWSQSNRGEDIAVPRLTTIFKTLADQKCHNWNLVSPTPWLPQIREALAPLEDVRLPIVYNTSGYESRATLDEYADLIDVALCDLRYADNATARAASQAGDYVEASRAALTWFWQHLGPLQEDEEGIAKRGTIVRLLILPGCAGETEANLRWLAENIGTEIHVSLMAQYTPTHRALALPAWNRAITEDEYTRVVNTLEDLGFENGWIQDYTPAPDSVLLGADMPPGHGRVG